MEGLLKTDHTHVNVGRISLHNLFFPISLPSSPFSLFTLSISDSASYGIWSASPPACFAVPVCSPVLYTHFPPHGNAKGSVRN